MKLTLKQILSMVMVVCLCFTMLPALLVQTNAISYSGSASYMSGKYYKQLCEVTLTGNSAVDIVNVARSQIGYQSGANSNDLSGSTTSTSNVKYSEYGRVIGNTNADWCAYFVSWCARQAGISTRILPNFAGCTTAYNTTLPQEAGCQMYRRGTCTPQAGDLIFFGTSKDDIYHVGIVTGSTSSTVYYIDGNNTSTIPHCVHDSSRSLWDSSIWGYARPNYTNTLVKHTVDSSYGTNFTAYPKAKITAENIFDAYHYQINSTSWIGTSDLCTIHEVYTDGCCRVTYPIDGGGTKTVYSKISLFSYQLPKPDKPIVSVTSNLFNVGSSINISWNSVPSATSYWIDIWCDGLHPVSKDVGLTTSYIYTADLIGNYSVYITAVNSADKTLSDVCEFTVEAFPSEVSVKTNNKSVTVSWSDVGATSYYMYVYNPDLGTTPYAGDQGKKLNYSLDLSAGNYIAYVTAVYSSDVKVSNSFAFSIYDYYDTTTNKGSNAKFNINEKVTVSVDVEDGDYTKCYYVLYHTPENGTRTLVEQQIIPSNSFTKAFSEPGKYECAFGVHSAYGYTEGKFVTWYVVDQHNCTEYGEWVTVKQPTFTSAGERNLVCTKCGNTLIETIDKLVGEVNQWNIVLEDDYAVNFYLQVSESIESTAKVQLSVGNVTVTENVSALEKTENGYFRLTASISAAQMNDFITVVVINGQEIGSNSTYTVREYCDTILADSAYSQYHVLVKEMLNYGAMAQLYFDYNTENLANDGITGVANEEVPETTEELAVNSKISSLKVYGASLVYRDRIAVRYYFIGDMTGCTFTANGNTYTPIAKDGMYYIEIVDILPQNLDQQITLTVTDAGGNTLTVTYGPMNYIVRMNEKGSETLKNLLKALYNYHLAAKAL